MMKLRVKPYEIEAIQFSAMAGPENDPYPVFTTNPPQWLLSAMELTKGQPGAVDWDAQGLAISTGSGAIKVNASDWLVWHNGTITVVSTRTLFSYFDPM